MMRKWVAVLMMFAVVLLGTGAMALGSQIRGPQLITDGVTDTVAKAYQARAMRDPAFLKAFNAENGLPEAWAVAVEPATGRTYVVALWASTQKYETKAVMGNMVSMIYEKDGRPFDGFTLKQEQIGDGWQESLTSFNGTVQEKTPVTEPRLDAGRFGANHSFAQCLRQERAACSREKTECTNGCRADCDGQSRYACELCRCFCAFDYAACWAASLFNCRDHSH